MYRRRAQTWFYLVSITRRNKKYIVRIIIRLRVNFNKRGERLSRDLMRRVNICRKKCKYSLTRYNKSTYHDSEQIWNFHRINKDVFRSVIEKNYQIDQELTVYCSHKLSNKLSNKFQ